MTEGKKKNNNKKECRGLGEYRGYLGENSELRESCYMCRVGEHGQGIGLPQVNIRGFFGQEKQKMGKGQM